MAAKNNKIKREDLEKVAAELNVTLGLTDPEINLQAGDGDLKESVLEGIGLIDTAEDYLPEGWEPENEEHEETPPGITPATQKLIKGINEETVIISPKVAEPPPPQPPQQEGEGKNGGEEKKEVDLMGLIKVTSKLKDLRKIVTENAVFNSLRERIAQNKYVGSTGPAKLKEDMLALLGNKDEKKTATKKGGRTGVVETTKKTRQTRSASNVEKFIAELEKGPKTMVEIKKAAWNTNKTTFYGIFNKLVREGKAKKEGSKLVLLKNKEK